LLPGSVWDVLTAADAKLVEGVQTLPSANKVSLAISAKICLMISGCIFVKTVGVN
jgi:hypothetical protein